MLFVYWLEDHPKYAARMNQIHARMAVRGDSLCTSAFTVGEVLTGFHKRNALDAASQIAEAFRSPQMRSVQATKYRPLTQSIWLLPHKLASIYSSPTTTACSASRFPEFSSSPAWM
jgi:hypothetical protein